MLRTLLTPRWLGALLAALALSTLFYVLGHWQWSKHVAHVEIATAVDAHYDAAPKPLAAALPNPRTVLDVADQWTRVSVTGTYAVDERLLVRGRVLDDQPGFEVLLPLDVNGGTLLVDRGWVPYTGSASTVPAVPGPPSGTVTVTGWLRGTESDRDRSLPQGQIASINLSEAADLLSRTDMYSAYLVLGDEKTDAGSRPTGLTSLGRPDTDLGPHQAYAYQWWGAIPVALLLVFFGVRNETRLLAGVPAAPKKKRIWDEEDE